MRRELAARDFGSLESVKIEGILNVFPVFHTAPVGQKIPCPAEAELFSASLEKSAFDSPVCSVDKKCRPVTVVLQRFSSF